MRRTWYFRLFYMMKKLYLMQLTSLSFIRYGYSSREIVVKVNCKSVVCGPCEEEEEEITFYYYFYHHYYYILRLLRRLLPHSAPIIILLLFCCFAGCGKISPVDSKTWRGFVMLFISVKRAGENRTCVILYHCCCCCYQLFASIIVVQSISVEIHR